MPDVLDEIIDRLSPSTIKKVLDLNSDSSRYSEFLSGSLKEMQEIKINQINKDLKRKIVELKSKTAENKNYLDKVKSDLESFNMSKVPDESQSLKAYTMKIQELQNQVKNLTKEFGEVDLTQLFNNVENLNEQIQDYKKKIDDIKGKIQCFDGFPPDIEQGKEAIAKVKERIKYHESAIESLY